MGDIFPMRYHELNFNFGKALKNGAEFCAVLRALGVVFVNTSTALLARHYAFPRDLQMKNGNHHWI